MGGGGRYDALIPSMGGGDIPASGFALYLDSLMGLVKPESVIVSTPERVLVQAKSDDVLKPAFEMADSLRQAGYIAEIDLDSKKATARWTIAISNKTPAFTLVDRSGRVSFSSTDELLKYLEGKSGD